MNRLKELRQNLGLSQAELAKIVESTQRNISYWENGEVELNLTVAIKLAQFFQVEVEYLAGYSDELGISPALSTNATNSYTPEERQLIEDFRQLNHYKQELIKSNIKAMLPTEAESAQKKKV